MPQALNAAFPEFTAGDLLISMRDLNLVAVLDGQTRQVKWHQTGPWIKQHDPEFRPDGRISVFNNNDPLISYDNFEKPLLDAPRVTNITAIDPATRETEVVYGQREGQELMSVIRGRHENMPDGSLLIVEFDAGRVLEVNSDGETIWEYVNAYDAERVGKVQDARVYPRAYFTSDLSCN